MTHHISLQILFLVSYIREALYGSGPVRGNPDKYKEKNREGYSPLYASFESFYTRNIYRRLKNVFNQPIASVPGATVTLIHRESGNFVDSKLYN
jgi:serine palmitoyltransferase